MNNRGIALILSYVVIMVLTIFATAFIARTVSDTNLTARYMDSTKAFWVAEAGLNQAYYNYKDNIPQPVGPVKFPGGGTYTIDASNLLAVKVTGTFGRTNAQRTVQASFVDIPKLFQNTLSVGGDLNFLAPGHRPASFRVGGKTRISGRFHSGITPYRGKIIFGTSWLEDMQEGVSVEDTTLGVPDYNNNGIENEYDDFVQMGRIIASSYPESEVIYLQTGGSVFLNFQSEISGKKIIFVEGDQEEWWGGGTTFIWNPSLSSGDDLTVISTHNIAYISSEVLPEDIRISTISWGQYFESTDTGEREGVIYSHSYGYWGGGALPLSTKLIKGNVIINGGMLLEGITNLELNYSDRVLRGDIPPGFKWLFTPPGNPRLMADWQEAE